MKQKKVVIIGGVAGGASAAARLRRLDENAHIVVVERGPYISFANCGLPYYLGGTIQDRAALTLQTPESFKARFNVDVRVFSEAVSIQPDNKTVTIHNHNTGEEYEESYDSLILSMGADAAMPPIPGIDSKKVFTVRNIPDTVAVKTYIEEHQAKKAVVAGGGFIGLEVAENLHELGMDVTLVEMADQVIPSIDADMAAQVHGHMRQKGLHLLLGSALQKIEDTETGVSLTVNGEPIDADLLVMAIGVRPASEIAVKAGLPANARGALIVNSAMETGVDGIYAVGDLIEITHFVTGEKGYIPLAGPANKQGRIAADNICGIPSRYTGTQGSSILKVFDLAVASTGISEKTAKALHLNYEKSFTFSANHATYYPGATNMSIKTLFEKDTGKILGAQIVGNDGVDKRCDVFATAIRAGMTAKDLTELELCYAPPFGSAKDPVNMAGYVIENMMSGLVKTFHWHDIEKISKDPDAFLLDTRNPMEYMAGTIPGFVNIPLDSLRDRLDEIPKDKTIYVTCQIGLRGYIAARILMQNGYDVYNLSGGYRLYQTIFG
ncbi:MAG TPA: FAD-dependent oxidoreductase [Candidatus Gallacutalibacter pullistercoris]|nr:FAD-dependent oxidoreductase [Candidatus Gallacutalibacter pullistercoris]